MDARWMRARKHGCIVKLRFASDYSACWLCGRRHLGGWCGQPFQGCTASHCHGPSHQMGDEVMYRLPGDAGPFVVCVVGGLTDYPRWVLYCLLGCLNYSSDNYFFRVCLL